MSETTTPEQPEVTKTATCPSLSGASTLTYEIGTTEEETFYRAVNNSAAGLFSKDWIPLSQITDLLATGNITSRTLQALYDGKSTNSAGFLLAVLKAEGLLVPKIGTKYQYCLPTKINPPPSAKPTKKNKMANQEE